MEISALLGLLGPISIALLLIIVGLLSKRLGEQTHAKPYYFGFYTAAGLMLISAAARFLELVSQGTVAFNDALRLLFEDALPALALSIGVYVAWRYWSWLLAERD